ncbi:MAG: BMP family ABC transporter substrate-binding protein [Rhizobiales bacterium]|nr:BMP family ABC transporter substrate-binding protein [Hyphomicrobiales bacterium]NRB12914.1 BMP family ABC transporter substrate-binding protein [Hyphomicrobiales bacterium]
MTNQNVNNGKSVNRRQVLKTTAGLGALGMALSMGISPALAAGDLVALVHTQAAGDNGPVDSMISELKKLAAEKGFTARTIYAKDPATYETIFRTLGEAGAAVVVSTFNEVAEPFKAVAPTFPDTNWIQLFGDAFEPPIANVVSVSYDYYLGCYLSGVFAAHVSATGKLGFIGGISIPPINADYNAFKAGAMSVNKDIEVSVAFAGSFQDPAKGLEVASQMYAGGIDYIQTDSGATDGGIISAANEKSGRMVSSLDPAQYELGPKSIISIVGLDFGASLANEAAAALKAGWIGGQHRSTGLGTGVIDFILSPLFKEQGDAGINAKSANAAAEVAKVRAAILDGSLKVPFSTEL